MLNVHPGPQELQEEVEASFRAFAWHKYRNTFALALKNDAIYLYDLNAQGMLQYFVTKSYLLWSMVAISASPRNANTNRVYRMETQFRKCSSSCYKVW